MLAGILFIFISNIFAVYAPVVVKNVLDEVGRLVSQYREHTLEQPGLLRTISKLVFQNGLLLLGLALMRGVFMFLMRQTIIVMSRHIEYDQKNEIYTHYQKLDNGFYKTHFTGDLMNRISEDVARVRQYTGPAVMYAINLSVLIILCVWGMISVNPLLTLFVVAPLPLLSFVIFYVNKIIHRKSEHIQAQLSDLTTVAQESYSGIRVIKSFVQEKNIRRFFDQKSEDYKQSAVNLSLTEAIYFPAMNLFIGLSLLNTIAIGGYFAIHGSVTAGNLAQFVMYINLLLFPISSIGWVASMMQRASASQKRINEFLDTEPVIASKQDAPSGRMQGSIVFDHVSFTYPHTGIKALKDFSLEIKPGEKVAIIGRTGSGKSTLAHLLIRTYDISSGRLLIDGTPVADWDLRALREQIAYAPQDTFLFSESVYNNILFGNDRATEQDVKHAAHVAQLEKDIASLRDGYDTLIGERGVMLSGGQKQRTALARALLKNGSVLILDESISAVDTQTEVAILSSLKKEAAQKTFIAITHRIFKGWHFDKIVIMEDGKIVEEGTHESLMKLNERYAKLYRYQTETKESV